MTQKGDAILFRKMGRVPFFILVASRRGDWRWRPAPGAGRRAPRFKERPEVACTCFKNPTSHWSRFASSDLRSLVIRQPSIFGEDMLERLRPERLIAECTSSGPEMGLLSTRGTEPPWPGRPGFVWLSSVRSRISSWPQSKRRPRTLSKTFRTSTLLVTSPVPSNVQSSL